MNNLIIQFAILWGEFIGGTVLSSKEMQLAEEMKQYDTEELADIFSDWAKEFLENDYITDSDSVEFFGEKLCELMHE